MGKSTLLNVLLGHERAIVTGFDANGFGTDGIGHRLATDGPRAARAGSRLIRALPP